MISFNRLATEIYEILSAPEYGYTLKMYNVDGDSTTTPRKVKWIYVEPDDVMLRLPIDGEAQMTPESTEVYFWKNQEIDEQTMVDIINRVRKICNLYGVGLTVKDFARGEMQKRFADMAAREIEEDQMDESIKRLGKLAGLAEDNGPMAPEFFEEVPDYSNSPRIDDNAPAFSLGDMVRLINFPEKIGTIEEVNEVGFNNEYQVRFESGEEGTFAEDEIYQDMEDYAFDGNDWDQVDLELTESMTGNERRSYFTLENARMVVVHEGVINPEKRGARSRNIKEIYVESAGERFRLPKKFVSGGKALCRHLNEGGSILDKTGRRIMEVIREAGALSSFIREFKEKSGPSLMEMASTRIRQIRNECGRMSGPKNYHMFKESFTKKPRIGKERIEEMRQTLVAEFGLNEGEEIHEGFEYLARLSILENVDAAAKVEQVLQHLGNDRDGGAGNLRELAKSLVQKRVPSSLTQETKKEMGFMFGQGLKRLWKEHGGIIADKLDAIAMSISDDFLSTLFNRITDKVIHGDDVRDYEIVIANMIKDGVIGKPTQTQSMADDAMNMVTEFVNKTSFDFLTEWNYPDNFRGTPQDSEPESSEVDAAHDEVIWHAKKAVEKFLNDGGEEAYGVDLSDQDDFTGLIQTLVDSFWMEIDEHHRDMITWDEMEQEVAKILKQAVQKPE